jgi:hypothetical protein
MAFDPARTSNLALYYDLLLNSNTVGHKLHVSFDSEVIVYTRVLAAVNDSILLIGRIQVLVYMIRGRDGRDSDRCGCGRARGHDIA